MHRILWIFIVLLLTAPAYAVEPDEFIGLEFRQRNQAQGEQVLPSAEIKTWTEPVTGMQFVWVPGGCFMMGSSEGNDDEKPVHEVCVDGFWIGGYEVTNAQFRKFRPNHVSTDYTLRPLNGDKQPAVQVTWGEAQDFAKWLSAKSNGRFRLPSEAEWEYAARGGTGGDIYSGGNAADAVAWYKENSVGQPHDVGSKAANRLGIYDMSGNVSEWCEDWYDAKAYSVLPKKNPVSDRRTKYKVTRGGGWSSKLQAVRVADRSSASPYSAGIGTGFRLVRLPEK